MKNLLPSTLIILITGCATSNNVPPKLGAQIRTYLQEVGITAPDIQSIQCTSPNIHGNTSCSVEHILSEKESVDLLLCNDQQGCREIPVDYKGRLVLPIEECDELRRDIE